MLVQARARLRYVSIPPQKMRLVADTVRGMPVEKALSLLGFVPRVAAHYVAKTVKSAAANALSLEGTDNLKPEDLVIRNIYVDAAPIAKRIRFQSMGRVFRYRKRYCHLTVELEGETEAPETRRARKRRAKAGSEAESEEAKKPSRKTKKPRLPKAPKGPAAEVAGADLTPSDQTEAGSAVTDGTSDAGSKPEASDAIEKPDKESVAGAAEEDGTRGDEKTS